MPVQTSGSAPARHSHVPARSEPFQHAAVDRVIAALVFVTCLAYLCIFRHFSSLEPDEGIVLQGATRILDGQLPYRDFFSFYTPGSFYLVAAIFRIFGNSFVIARVSVAVVGALCSVITYLIARRVCPRSISVLAAVLATVTGAAFRLLVLHNWYSTLLACLSVYAAVRVTEDHKRGWALAVGSFTALTFLFEQSKGGGLALGLLLGFLLLGRAGPLHRRNVTISIAAGLVWPLLITFGYFAGHHAFHQMIGSWMWPLQHYTAANHVRYGWQNWTDETRDAIFRTGPWPARILKIVAVTPGFIIPILPLIGVGMLVYWVVQLRKRPEVMPLAEHYVIVCSASAGLLLSVAIVRPDVLHFVYLTPLWYVILAWILGAPQPSRLLQRIRPVLIAYTAAAFGMLGFALLLATTGAHNRIETRRGLVTTSAPDTVIAFVQAHTNPGDDLLVYPYLPLYSYLTATRSPSPYDFFQPGMNTRGQGREIIQSMQLRDGRAVLFEPWFPEKFAYSWPGTPLAAVARDPVADYILRSFRICKMLDSPNHWRFEYMIRKGLPCPSS